ncbi:MAG: H+-translocating transhydrogenase subunit alpha [Microbacteriaceae bacterium]|nr:H+-translocating transhydrogenase subunit alpha [Microbacteriaceae bacterium]
MTALAVGALKETAPGERRVALDPEAVARLVAAGKSVFIESGAGTAASFTDAAFETSGATVGTRAQVIAAADVLAVVRYPDDAVASTLRSGQVLLGLVDPLNHLAETERLASAGITVVALELLPRTVSRAQAMDALSSQSSAAGYRAGIVAAEAFGRYLPMMITASGTARPAKVIVIGTGVAGLQAIATTKRLGAVVTGYDVRADSRGEVESLGAQFMTSSVSNGAGAGGYARALTAEEQATQENELAAALVGFDIIITTAKVPGRTPPVLVSARTLAALHPGSVCIDLGSSDRGGNVAGSVDGATVVTEGGVTVVGAGELASDLPTSSSQMYGRNVVSVLASLAPGEGIEIDPTDAVHLAIVVSHSGEITNAQVRAALDLDPLEAHPATTSKATTKGTNAA